MNENRPLDKTSFAIRLISSILSLSWSYEIRNSPQSISGSKIFALWHEYILPVVINFKDKNKTFIVSGSRDGKRLSAILQSWGFRIITGSSSKGGSNVIKNSTEAIKNGQDIIITPDGPRGPRRKAKRGVAKISIMNQTPIIPVRIFPQKYWRLTSWDKFIIPKPFTKIVLEFGDPLYPDGYNLENETFNDYIKLIESELTPKEEQIERR